jgi:hypothetical protein
MKSKATHLFFIALMEINCFNLKETKKYCFGIFKGIGMSITYTPSEVFRQLRLANSNCRFAMEN